MSRLYDPISKTVYEQEEPKEPPTLQSQCRKVIIQALTLKRLKEVDDLPLPYSLKLMIGTLSMKDFLIDVERVSPENHVDQCYPATCHLNNEDVIIRVIPKFADFTSPNFDPSLIGYFEEGNFICCILLPTQSLAEKIDKAKESGTTLNHSIIWQTLSSIIDTFEDGQISPISRISSLNVKYHTNGQISINFPSDDDTGIVTVMEAQMNAPVYEAPEVLSRQEPDDRAHSWNIGCLVYEMLALEPAFYDKSGVNPFSVYMDIMQGNLPQIPTSASESLTDIVTNCLVLNPADRYCLQDIKEAVLLHDSKSL